MAFLSYAVAQRRREIGIRMALGAQREQIGTQFLSLGLRLLAAGTILGLIGAWLAGRAMQSVLFDVPTLPRRHSFRHCAHHGRGVIGRLSHPRAPRDQGRSDDRAPSGITARSREANHEISGRRSCARSATAFYRNALR